MEKWKNPNNETMPRPGLLRADWQAWAVLAACAAALFGVELLFSARAVLGDPAHGDMTSQMFAWRRFAFGDGAAGAAPLWNPFIFSGAPFAAGMQSALFYPIHLIYRFLPTAMAINWVSALQMLMLGLFQYAFLRLWRVGRDAAVFGAAALMLGSASVLHLYAGHLPNQATFVWFPLMLLFGELTIRRGALRLVPLGAAVYAMQILAGHAQYLFYSSVMLGLYLIMRYAGELVGSGRGAWRRVAVSAALAAAMVAGGVLLSAAQLLPALEYVRHSARGAGGLPLEYCAMFSFPPENFITLLMPDYFGDIAHARYWGRFYYWEMCAYAGLLPAALGVYAVARRRAGGAWVFAALAGAASLLAAGAYTPLFGLLYNYVYGFDMFRGNSKWIFYALFGVSCLGALGFERLVTDAGEAGAKRVWILAACFTAAVIAALAVTVFNSIDFLPRLAAYMAGPKFASLSGQQIEELIAAVSPAVDRAGVRLILAGAACAAALALAAMRVPARVKIAALLAVTIADLMVFAFPYIKGFDPARCGMPGPAVRAIGDYMKNEDPPERVLNVKYYNTGMIHGLHEVTGYDANAVRRYNRFINAALERDPDYFDSFPRINGVGDLMSILNIGYIVLDARYSADGPATSEIYSDAETRVYRYLTGLSRAYVAYNPVFMKTEAESFEMLRREDFDAYSRPVIEQPGTAPPGAAPAAVAPSPARIEHYESDRVEIEAATQRPGWLVLGDVFYPGWRATVDGKPTRVLPANYTLRAVFIPGPGEHKIVFSFRPASVAAGLAASLAALVAAFIMLLIPAVLRRTETPCN